LTVLPVFVLFILALLTSIYVKVSILYPLLLGLIGFTLAALRQGYPLGDLVRMMLAGSKKSLIVIKIFILIGAITAIWRAAGTIPCIVYHGIDIMNPRYFILFAFFLSSGVSFLLGSSFGTVGTIGVVLAILAKSGGIDINIAAGAIIAGAYFGDRCSPMSSSANLVATITRTDLYANINAMFKTSILPFLLACIGYLLLSWQHPLSFHNNAITLEIAASFDLSLVTLLPAVIILAGAAMKADVKLSMFISILSGLGIAILVQHKTPGELLSYILMGYTTDGAGFFTTIIQGGGLYSMLNAAAIVLISSAFSGIFAGTNLLDRVEQFLEITSQRIGVYATTLLTSITAAAFSCNQTLAVMLSHQFTATIYKKRRLSSAQLALDLENTVIVISALIPWNIAGAVPAAALSATEGFIPYAFYLFLLPLVNFFVSPAKHLPEGK